jgi:hypothetical protein
MQERRLGLIDPSVGRRVVCGFRSQTWVFAGGKGIYHQRAGPATKSGGVGWVSSWMSAREPFSRRASESLALLSYLSGVLDPNTPQPFLSRVQARELRGESQKPGA